MRSLIALVMASLAVFVSAEDLHRRHPRRRPCNKSSSWSSGSSYSSSSSSSEHCHRKPCCGCPKEKGLKWAKKASQEYLNLLTERLFDAATVFQTDNFQTSNTVLQCPFADQCFSSPEFDNIFEIFNNTSPFELGPIVQASYQHDGSILVIAPYNFYFNDFDSVSFNVLLRWVWTADCLLKVNLGVLVDIRCPATLKMLLSPPENFCPPPNQTYTPPYITTTSTSTFYTGTFSTATNTSTVPTTTLTTTSTTSTSITSTTTTTTTTTTEITSTTTTTTSTPAGK